MNVITTNLTTSGNSTAVRLPKELLKMSALSNRVSLQAKKGQIIISSASNPRDGWKEMIDKEIKLHGNISTKDDYGDMLKEGDATIADGIK